MFGKFTEAFTGKAGGGFKRPSRPRKSFDNQNLKMLVSIAEKQLIIVGVLFFLMVGVNFFLKQYDLLFGSTGAVHGAGFTDVNVTLWMYRIMMGLCSIRGHGIRGRNKRGDIVKPAVVAPIIMIMHWSVLGTGAALASAESGGHSGRDQQRKQVSGKKHRIYSVLHTGLNDVNKKEFAASNDLIRTAQI